jgi:ribosomal-protein-alanine N-acetyltransferase
MKRIIEIENQSFPVDAFTERTFKYFHAKCADLFSVAELEDQITGYIIACRTLSNSNIVSIAVARDNRRKGIGKTLVEHTLKKLKRFPVDTVELEVRVNNLSGISFWRSMGFDPFRYLYSYYHDGQDAVKMSRKL